MTCSGALAPAQQRSARRVQGLAVRGLRETLELFVLDREDPSATLTVTGSYERAELSPRRAWRSAWERAPGVSAR